MKKVHPVINKIRLYRTYLLEAFSYFSRTQRIHSYPIVFEIETTNNCPMNCVMCPRKYMKRKIGYMSFELFKKIIDQVKLYDKCIQLHHFGDPLMHPQIAYFIELSS